MSIAERDMADRAVLPRVLPRPDAAPPRPAHALRRLLVVLDASAAALAWSVALLLAQGPAPGSYAGLNPDVLTAIALAGLTLVFITVQRLYVARVCTIRAVEIGRLGRAVFTAAAFGLLLDEVVGAPFGLTLPAATFGGLLAFSTIVLSRGVYRSWLLASRRDGRFVRPLVVIGANDEGFDLCKLIGDHPELGYRVVGVIGSFADVRERDFHVPHVGTTAAALASVESIGANGVIMAPSALEPNLLNDLVRQFMAAGVHVHLSSGIRGIDSKRVRAQPIAHEPLFYVEPLQLARWQLSVKRMLDLGITLVGGTFVALPVVALAAVAIKLQDRGPVLFKQVRVGRNGEHFTVYKLRTMIPNAEALLDEVMDGNEREGVLFKRDNDPRRTTVGRLLERLSIDEAPQLINVLKGEMSLVGPRPALPSEVAQFDDELRQRLLVPPGITGLWQVEARDNPSFDAYRRYDLFYIENWSVGLDLAVLVATAQRVALRGLHRRAERRRQLKAVKTPAHAPVTGASYLAEPSVGN